MRRRKDHSQTTARGTARRGRLVRSKADRLDHSVRSSEGQHGDLARRENPKGRAPESRAAAGVELGPITVSTQTMHHWLLQPDKEIERPDLATVSMTRNLKVDARAHRVRNLLGLMCEEKDRQRPVGFCEGGL